MTVGSVAKQHNRGSRHRKCLFHKALLAVCVLILGGCFVLRAEAAPATLQSSSAVIYEQTSEGSTPVGSLVQDSSFEYLGDVTAEDGSVWHAVATSTGVSGYIRGELEVREAGNADGEQEVSAQTAPEEAAGEMPEGASGPEQGEVSSDGQQAGGGDGQPEYSQG